MLWSNAYVISFWVKLPKIEIIQYNTFDNQLLLYLLMGILIQQTKYVSACYKIAYRIELQ